MIYFNQQPERRGDIFQSTPGKEEDGVIYFNQQPERRGDIFQSTPFIIEFFVSFFLHKHKLISWA